MIDADDTLWENAVYFAASRQAFGHLLGRFGHSSHHALEVLQQCEQVHLSRRLYGSRRLHISMQEAVVFLEPQRVDELLAELVPINAALRHHVIRFHVCVVPTLAKLATRFPLHLVTMGERSEQIDKIKRAGISQFFADIDVLDDKDEETYRRLMTTYNLHPAGTWMIGNSAKKDIEPAHRCGLKTVWIPSTAYHEVEHDPPQHGPTIRLERFNQLWDVFGASK